MEEICRSLSAILCENGTGGYKIYYEEELLEALPADMRNRETLEAALKNLQGGGFVDVRYARGNAFCIAAVKLFQPTVPQTPAESENTDKAPENTGLTAAYAPTKRIFWLFALSAFLGGVAGGLVAFLLGAIV